MTEKFKMDKYMKEQWLGCLLGGEYRQVTKTLKKRGGHCCLGVLSEEMGLRDMSGRLKYPLEEDGGVDRESINRLWKRNDAARTKDGSYPKEVIDYIMDEM